MKTDAEGRFEYDTIRPGSYPGSTIAAHVHHQAWGSGVPPQWVSDLNFADDPFVSPPSGRARRLPAGSRGCCLRGVNASGSWSS